MAAKVTAAHLKAKAAFERNQEIKVAILAARYKVARTTIYRADWYKEHVKSKAAQA